MYVCVYSSERDLKVQRGECSNRTPNKKPSDSNEPDWTNILTPLILDSVRSSWRTLLLWYLIRHPPSDTRRERNGSNWTRRRAFSLSKIEIKELFWWKAFGIIYCQWNILFLCNFYSCVNKQEWHWGRHPITKFLHIFCITNSCAKSVNPLQLSIVVSVVSLLSPPPKRDKRKGLLYQKNFHKCVAESLQNIFRFHSHRKIKRAEEEQRRRRRNNFLDSNNPLGTMTGPLSLLIARYYLLCLSGIPFRY